MSVQFGSWDFHRTPPDGERMERMRSLLVPYAPDGINAWLSQDVSIIFGAFDSTGTASSGTQPHVLRSGNVVTWDGRLDNRTDVVAALGGSVSDSSSDLATVCAALDAWGDAALPKFIGDWALSLWNPRERTLLLAKDFLGSRPLYYTLDNSVRWSALLEPLVLETKRPLKLNKEYVAGWLAFYPATDTTPFAGISSVPPACSVLVRNGKATVRTFWSFDSRKLVRHKMDQDYEEQFRELFAQSVRRRLRSNRPVLAELSGGMDSSSIVCVADQILARGCDGPPCLDTVSYYDNSEPNWNERPYLQAVEALRKRAGTHIDISSERTIWPEYDEARLPITPLAGMRATERQRRFSACVAEREIHVVLSGVGGDEVLGGIPTPLPELGDLIASGQMTGLLRQLLAWTVAKRDTVPQLFAQTIKCFLPARLQAGLVAEGQPRWLDSAFARRYRIALFGYRKRWGWLGPPPSFQERLLTLDAVRRHIACSTLPFEPVYEIRYPYLDRDLLEFLFAVPRSQLVRPRERRSLMRRALVGIVPSEILNRRRKAFVVRRPMIALAEQSHLAQALAREMLSEAFGFVNRRKFIEAIETAQKGSEIPLVPLLRTLTLESWLAALCRSGLLTGVHGAAGNASNATKLKLEVFL
jgi:asparagine synthase (glutamine-hydrolysing)